MADEIKQEEKKTDAKKTLSTLFKVVLGIAFIVVAIYLLVSRSWWMQTWVVIKGCAAPFLVLAGLITLAIAKE
ncbi:MAG: hypothetical protein ABH882_02395 [Candidatus Omnitrophota bacterium]|nr:hypothetical protein [Candidatus Omnitrophota bacterium]MBU1928237.1 hypothetical protein [Candidatus Omnitrophota bacterium]MBU2034425.1 hypothetical protein [Candidatus Omnitrophota bacterium]MBU2222181.1 hypothetical protein [Candidatus Omnitrophota bacterium]MBU2258612.1 hypothetical protein [Candidatus Omnitrophota bacterium]